MNGNNFRSLLEDVQEVTNESAVAALSVIAGTATYGALYSALQRLVQSDDINYHHERAVADVVQDMETLGKIDQSRLDDPVYAKELANEIAFHVKDRLKDAKVRGTKRGSDDLSPATNSRRAKRAGKKAVGSLRRKSPAHQRYKERLRGN